MTKRPPTTDGDRALTGRGRGATPPTGVRVVDPLASTAEELERSFDADDFLTPPPQMVDDIRRNLESRRDLNVEQLELAMIVADAVAKRLGEHATHAHKLTTNRVLEVLQASPAGADSRVNVRLAALETWRETQVDPWRLRLTGVDEQNGRLGKMDRTIAKLREDVGPSDECASNRTLLSTVGAAVKAMKRRALYGVAAGVLALGGTGYSVKTRDEARDAAIRADARMEIRLEVLEQGFLRLVERLDRSFGRGRSAPPPDSDQPARTP